MGKFMMGLRLLLLCAVVTAAVAQKAPPKPAAKGATAAPAAAKTAAAAPKLSRKPPKIWPWANPGLQRVKSYNTTAEPAIKLLEYQKVLPTFTFSEKPLAAVPKSFLGLSLDLNDIEGVASPDYIHFIKLLTAYDTGPMFMRVGAYSADRLIKPWPGTVYKALTQLNAATGMQFIMGINQHAEDPEVTREQVKRSEKLLPKGSIVSFAVGNEPDMYSLPAKKGQPGSALPKEPNWLRNKWIPVSRAVFKAAFEAADNRRILSGPDWSDTHMEPGKMAWFLNTGGGVKQYLNAITVHHYGGNIFKDKSISDLLDDTRISNRMDNVRALVKVGIDNGNLPLRVTEVATLSYGGVMGISDTAGAAIWALDTALELAHAGAAGVHFHQVLNRAGNANYNAISYNATTSDVRVRIPFYGYLMLQQALAGGASITGRQISGGCKVWTLKGSKKGDIRFVVINKSPDKECGANVKLDIGQMKRYADVGEAHYMYAALGLLERWRLYYSNTFFDQFGTGRSNEELTAPVTRYVSRGKGGAADGGGFLVHLTRGTIAALVSVPEATPEQKKAFEAILKGPAPAAAATAEPAAGAKPGAAAKPKAGAARGGRRLQEWLPLLWWK